MEFKPMVVDGQEVNMPVINIGDEVSILMEDRDDPDLAEWLEEYEGKLIVTDVDYDAGTIWLEDCDYGVDMNFISNVKSNS